jgi:hypothetical protein
LSYPGFGYATPPVVSLVGGGGFGARAKAILEDGVVVGFEIINPGQGYSSAPFVRIDPPASIQVPATSLDVQIKTIQVVLHVAPFHRYALEGTANFIDWAQVGAEFQSDSNTVVKVFDVADAPKFFRIRDITYTP